MSTSPYHEASIILNKLLAQCSTYKSSFKSLIYNKNQKLTCSKTTYAQICQTIQYKHLIDAILSLNNDHLKRKIKTDSVHNKGLLYILLYEFLFGRYGKIKGGGVLKRTIMNHERELKCTKQVIMTEKKEERGRKMISRFPKYVRVNTLHLCIEKGIELLRKTSGMDDDEDIYMDRHVPDLLVFSPLSTISWHEQQLVKSGSMIIQDKSSCFPALALCSNMKSDNKNNTNIGDVIDACAAPGNKTLHVAALLEKWYSWVIIPKIFAFDRSSTRIAMLRHRISTSLPPINSNTKTQKMNTTHPKIIPIHQDFLTVNPFDKTYINVKNILIDPSCSGSGIVNTPDRILDHQTVGKEEDKNKGSLSNRIGSLANFQLLMIKHATSFPHVDRIVYSTCSIHDKENECVVAMALKEVNANINNDDKERWELVSPPVLKKWKRRGHALSGLTQKQAECLIRVDGMHGDATNGFFVCCLERRKLCNTDVKNEEGVYSHWINENHILPTGIKDIYNGQFEMGLNDQNEIVNGIEYKENMENECMMYNSSMIMTKKICKKLAWKQKQKKSKLERIEKRKTGKREVIFNLQNSL